LVFTTLSASSPELGIASPRLFQNPDYLGIYNTFCTLLQILLVFTTLSASSPELGIASPRLFQNPDYLGIYNTFCILLQIILVFTTRSAHCSRLSWYLQHFLQVVQSWE